MLRGQGQKCYNQILLFLGWGGKDFTLFCEIVYDCPHWNGFYLLQKCKRLGKPSCIIKNSMLMHSVLFLAADDALSFFFLFFKSNGSCLICPSQFLFIVSLKAVSKLPLEASIHGTYPAPEAYHCLAVIALLFVKLLRSMRTVQAIGAHLSPKLMLTRNTDNSVNRQLYSAVQKKQKQCL